VTPDPVRAHAERRPDAPALVTPETALPWAGLDARVGGAAARLAEGPRRVAVQARTSPDLVVLVLAALRARRVLVPLSTRWPPAAAADALGRLGLDLLLTDGTTEPPPGVAVRGLADATRQRAEGAAPPLSPDRPFTVVHTSGSTGRPKAALHTVGNHVWSARGVNERMGLGADGRWLLDLPLYHVGGLGVVVRCALAGAAVAVPTPGTGTAGAVRDLRPTHASLVSTQLRRLLDADADASSLRAVLLGGSAVPAELLDRAVRRGLPVATSYGLTEMTSTVTATDPGAPRADLATSGRALARRRLRVSEAGEVEVGGPALFAGYLDGGRLRPPGAWHPTGDLGRLDAEGRLVVTGRRDLLFVSGGENVQPEAVEAALLRLEAVAEAAVVPVPDAEFGARPVAFVRPAGGAPVDGARLAAALRQRLAGFEVPVAFHAWGGAGGMKPDRPVLTREAERRAAQTGEGGGPGGPRPPAPGP
jgi:O-succinylbenzoic acid--CoA ligase